MEVQNQNYMQVLGNYGWICPVCKRVLAPFIQECPCKGQLGEWSVTTTHQDSLTIPYDQTIPRKQETITYKSITTELNKGEQNENI